MVNRGMDGRADRQTRLRGREGDKGRAGQRSEGY